MKTKPLRKLTLFIIEDLKKQLEQTGFIDSFTFLKQNPKKFPLSKINDIDFCIVVKGKITPKKLREIHRIFNSMKKYSSKELDIVYAIKDGPMKPISNKKFIIFIHSALHTKNTYKKAPKVLIYSWQFLEPLFGTRLEKIKSFESLDKSTLLNGVLGLKDLVELCDKERTGYLEWKIHKGKCVLKRYFSPKLKGKELAEIYFYSVLRVANNHLKFLRGLKIKEIGIEKKMVDEYSKLKNEHSNLPKKILGEKEKLRANKLNISKKYLEDTKKITINFLNYLINSLK